MGGGVNPIEWVLPPLALTHTIVDQGAKMAGAKLPAVPGSPDARAQAAEDQQKSLLDQANQSAAARIAGMPRPQTPQEELESRRRAAAAAVNLGGGKRPASQYLTDPGGSLSGSA